MNTEHKITIDPPTHLLDESGREQILNVGASSSGVTYESDEVPFIKPTFAEKANKGEQSSANEDIVSPNGPF